jgi:lipoate-protein ligase A
MSSACRLLPAAVAPGPWNMAADDALLESAAAGVASLRFYGWTEPTLSLGYFQPSGPARAYPGLAGLARVRRPTGGAALVHHRELTYALALPPGGAWQSAGTSWLVRMHAVLQSALARLGVVTRLCEREEKFGDVLCFLHHTPGDLLVEGHKVVGSAQRKMRGALLQHGGILLARSPHTPALPGIAELSGRSLSPEDVQAAVVTALGEATGWRIQASEWTEAEEAVREERIGSRYTRAAWNEKR